MDAEDYPFVIDCFNTTDPDDDLDAWDDHDGDLNKDRLQEKAKRLVGGGRFGCVILYRLAPNGEDWIELERWIKS